MKKFFNLFGIVLDKYGYVLVVDWSNYVIYFLDLSGQFIGFLIIENYGICGLNVLVLDKEGYLWVGDIKLMVWVFKYVRRVEYNNQQLKQYIIQIIICMINSCRYVF